MIYDFIFKGKKNYLSNYQTFLKNNINLSWMYSLESLEIENYSFENNLTNDFTFIITEKNIPVALVPIFIKSVKNTNYITWNDYYGYLLSPIFEKSLNKKHKSKIEKFCFEKIDEIVKIKKIKKIKMMIDPYSDKADNNFLKKYGFIDTSTSTCYVNLNLHLNDLWSDIRTSYKGLINQSIKEFEIEIVDKFNCNELAHNKYKEFHHKTAKRITRPTETWEIQYNMVKLDKAMLICLKKDSSYVAFSYFYHMNDSAFYASASDDPEFNSKNSVQHLIIWEAIKYYKKRNFNELDLGFQDYKNQLWYNPSQKDLTISFFKRGFSSLNKNIFRGIKYYCLDMMKKDFDRKKNNLINSIK